MRRYKKGYITIYVLLACLLCIIITAYIFNLEVRRTRNAESYSKIVSTTKKYDDYKEYAFTYMHRLIISSISNLDYAGVNSYLSLSNPKIKFDNNKACIKYDSVINKIVLETYYDSDYYRRDLYDYKVDSGKIKYVYLKTTYIEGRIQ